MVKKGFILDGVERCLKDYPDNIKRIRERREYLTAMRRKSPFEQRYNGGVRVPEQEALLMLFDDDWLLRDLTSKVDPVKLFLDTTATTMDKKLLQLRYFNRLSWEETAEQLHHTSTHLRGYHRTRLLERASACFQAWHDEHE